MSGQNIEIVKLQVRRGPEAQLPVLDSGEPAITTDTNKFFIGDGTTNHQLANLDDLSNVNSQLAQKASLQATQNFLYNRDALASIRGGFFRALALGDSIANGDGSDSNGMGFLQALEYAMQYKQNFINHYFINFYGFQGTYNWTAEESGINGDLISATSTSSPLDIFLGVSTKIPQVAYTVKLIYSTRSDGGSSTIIDGSGTTLGTINFNGASQDGLIATFTVSAGKTLKINQPASGKAYINGAKVILNTSIATTSEYYLETWARHGRKSTDLSNSQIDSMFNYSNFNLFIYEFLTNDFLTGTLTGYQTATNYILSEAKAKGMAVLIVIPCGSSTSVGSSLYQSFKSYLYQTAQTNGYAILDFDNYFGGYTNMNRYGAVNSDGVHPNDYGYSLMAKEISQLLLEIDNQKVYRGNTQHSAYGLKTNTDNQYLQGKILTDQLQVQTFNSGGWGYNYLPPMPLINASGTGSFPKYAPIGSVATINGTTLYVNSTDWGTSKNIAATWNALMTQPNLPKVTSLPTPSAAIRGQMVLFDNNGTANDIVYACIAITGGTQAWIALNPSTLSVPIVNSLPTASGQNRGQMYLLNNNGTANDVLYVCIAVTGGTQQWKQITLT